MTVLHLYINNFVSKALMYLWHKRKRNYNYQRNLLPTEPLLNKYTAKDLEVVIFNARD
jgi:hypothetical protein